MRDSDNDYTDISTTSSTSLVVLVFVHFHESVCTIIYSRACHTVGESEVTALSLPVLKSL